MISAERMFVEISRGRHRVIK